MEICLMFNTWFETVWDLSGWNAHLLRWCEGNYTGWSQLLLVAGIIVTPPLNCLDAHQLIKTGVITPGLAKIVKHFGELENIYLGVEQLWIYIIHQVQHVDAHMQSPHTHTRSNSVTTSFKAWQRPLLLFSLQWAEACVGQWVSRRVPAVSPDDLLILYPVTGHPPL